MEKVEAAIAAKDSVELLNFLKIFTQYTQYEYEYAYVLCICPCIATNEDKVFTTLRPEKEKNK